MQRLSNTLETTKKKKSSSDPYEVLLRKSTFPIQAFANGNGLQWADYEKALGWCKYYDEEKRNSSDSSSDSLLDDEYRNLLSHLLKNYEIASCTSREQSSSSTSMSNNVSMTELFLTSCLFHSTFSIPFLKSTHDGTMNGKKLEFYGRVLNDWFQYKMTQSKEQEEVTAKTAFDFLLNDDHDEEMIDSNMEDDVNFDFKENTSKQDASNIMFENPIITMIEHLSRLVENGALLSQFTTIVFSQDIDEKSLEEYSLNKLLTCFSSPIEFCTKTKRVSYPYAYFVSHQLSMVANQLPDASQSSIIIIEYCQRLVVKLSREVVGLETLIISLGILKSRNESHFHFFSKIMFDIWSSKIMCQFNRQSKYLMSLVTESYEISLLDVGLCPYVILQVADFSNDWRNHVVTEITKKILAFKHTSSDETRNGCSELCTDPYLNYLISIMSDYGSLELSNFMKQWKKCVTQQFSCSSWI
ncbi:hypothetical protein C9374_009026 [Naegleria lovaniensis]|uniref:Uncharacterized protein n=1 Tax=Naegleria lovaniensis TaxID=51637 RepID=A0AA88GIN5_NAELO|nr:uncharacterized protein C9374_009026 [Naegleria lovaniensis]KAG2377510.1 hypothetical protein C9374_009026 [Naegleria lovaniensis]